MFILGHRGKVNQERYVQLAVYGFVSARFIVMRTSYMIAEIMNFISMVRKIDNDCVTVCVKAYNPGYYIVIVKCCIIVVSYIAFLLRCEVQSLSIIRFVESVPV